MTSLVTFTSAPAILGGKRDSEELLCAVGCVNLCQNKSTIGTSPDPLSPREGLASETNHLLPLHSLFSHQPAVQARMKKLPSLKRALPPVIAAHSTLAIYPKESPLGEESTCSGHG